MKRITIITALLLAMAGVVRADEPMRLASTSVVGSGVSAAACAAQTGNVLAEGFEGGASSCGAETGVSTCNSSWSSTKGTNGAIAIETSPGTPSEGANCTKSMHTSVALSGGATYVSFDNGSAIVHSSYNVTITFYVYVHSYTLPADYDYTNLVNFCATSGISDCFGSLAFYRDTTHPRLRAYSDSNSSASAALTTDTWYKITIYLDAARAAGGSYFAINDGTHVTFTRLANNYRYLNIGIPSGLDADETVDVYIAYITINKDTP
jgi:hypothetical protein